MEPETLPFFRENEEAVFIPLQLEEPKKRGRKPKDPATTPKPKTRKTDRDLSTAVYTVGNLIIGIFGKPELAITEDESKIIGEAANKVAEYYELPDMGLAGAWINLGICLSMLIYPRYQIIRETMKAEKEEKTDDN